MPAMLQHVSGAMAKIEREEIPPAPRVSAQRTPHPRQPSVDHEHRAVDCLSLQGRALTKSIRMLRPRILHELVLGENRAFERMMAAFAFGIASQELRHLSVYGVRPVHGDLSHSPISISAEVSSLSDRRTSSK